jgi:hypothetical protein
LPLQTRTHQLLARFDAEAKGYAFNDSGDGTTYAEWFADLLDEWQARGDLDYEEGRSDEAADREEPADRLDRAIATVTRLRDQINAGENWSEQVIELRLKDVLDELLLARLDTQEGT